MTYPSYIIMRRLVTWRLPVWIWRIAVAAIGALVMTSWDLAMDPLMVAGGPLQNYWGWWLTVFSTFILFLILGQIKPQNLISSETSVGFARLAVFSYLITGLGTILIDFQAGLDGPALVGLFSMAPWGLLAI